MSINIGGDLFLSTPSARRATFNKIHKTKMKYISIHALREEGDLLDQFLDSIHISISIHALREEGDASSSASRPTTSNFYPRPPRGGRPTDFSSTHNAL